MDLQRMELKSEFLYRAHVDVEEFYDVGRTFRGHRQIVKAKGGWFEGPKLKGEILPGTGDWFIIRPGGVAEGDVRDTYRTHDGHIIYVSYRGIIGGGRVLLDSQRDFLGDSPAQAASCSLCSVDQ